MAEVKDNKDQQNQDGVPNAPSKVQTTKSLKTNKRVTTAQLDAEIKNSADFLAKEKKVEVTIPKFLEKRLGKNVPVGINGAVVHVPVGEKVKIPEPLAKILNQSISELKL